MHGPLVHTPRIRGCPPAELARSPAATAIGRLAAESGLFLFDYEARVQLELPEHWLPLERPDLGVTGSAPTWERGVLPESKYLSFRHDLLLGSLHAGHRAKWSAHELAHGLVGFAWAPDATLLFHALAARLAEALPVALWYFFDEAGLVRCWRHAAQSEVGPAYCAACDEAAAHGALGSGVKGGDPEDPGDAEDQHWRARGRAFLARELAAVRHSIAAGRPIATPHGGVDLMGDGLSYAAAHAARLRSPEFERYVQRFCAGDGSGRHASLEALAARVEAVASAMLGEVPAGGAPAPWTANHVACDLGWRLLQIGAETDGECDAELERLVDRLAAHAHGVPAGASQPAFDAVLDHVVTAYEALHADYELPSPEDVFAVGYPLVRGYGRSVSQIQAGLATVCPQALAALGSDADAVVRAFVQAGAADPQRTPLGLRFAAFVAHSAAGDLARLEAAIGHAAPPDPYELTLGFDDVKADHFGLARGVTLVDAESDVAARLFGGPPSGARHWLVRRDAGDQVGLAALSPSAAAFVRDLRGGPAPIETLYAHGADTEIGALVAEGILVPVLAPEVRQTEPT